MKFYKKCVVVIFCIDKIIYASPTKKVEKKLKNIIKKFEKTMLKTSLNKVSCN